MIRIHRIRTGSVRIKNAQRQRQSGGLLAVLAKQDWTDWLPIYAWLIEHPEGLILVDSGETARTAEPGYFPRWQIYYRLAVQMKVEPDQEVGPQLRSLGVAPEDVATVILTHLHTDHAGGLAHFPHSRILVAKDEYAAAQGFAGKLQGYLPHRWPDWFVPETVPFTTQTFGPFTQSYAVTQAGDVVIVPTPGHTPNHISVIVKSGGRSYFLAGDTSYSQMQLVNQIADGVSPDPEVARQTLRKIQQFAQQEPTIYLPSHDPLAADRLQYHETVS